MILNKIKDLLRPTKTKLIITIPIFLGLFLLKFFLFVSLFIFRGFPEPLAFPIGILVMAGTKFASAGSVFVNWLDSLFWITDGSGGIIKRPDFMLLLLKLKWVFDLIWAYVLGCLVIAIYNLKKVNRNECVPDINKYN